MERIEDNMLIDEVKRRLEESRIAVANLRTMTRNLEAVNEKLRQSEALKSDFLSNIRNEINNPLAAILGLSRQITDPVTDSGTARTMAATIYHEAFDLDFQLRNIFCAAELEAGESDLSPAHVDILAMLRSMMDEFDGRAAERGVRIELEPPADGISWTIVTDPEKLVQVLANLLANAIEFNREGGRVRIHVRRNGDETCVAIADEGIGISPADHKKIFDRFVQLDTGARKHHRGHGIGLSVVKALAEMLGGRITVESTQGQGSIFSFSFVNMQADDLNGMTSSSGNELIFDEGTAY